VVLVLDRSGSMGGWKMVAARRAAARIVDTLGGDDRFTVLAFDFETKTPQGLPDTLVEATDRNRFRAVEFLSSLDARGGTEMLSPLRRAADLLHGSADRERVLVLVTDGQVGNEDQILSELAPKLTGVRVHTVGIDRAVNEAFLQRLAGSAGRCELVESEDRLDEAMHNIHRRIGTPLVTDLQVTPDGLVVQAATLAPAPVPDLYPGAPVVVMGQYAGAAEGGVVVSGQPNWRTHVTVTESSNPALDALWARAMIRDLEDRYVTGESSLEGQIVSTSLGYDVLCRFTAFVAVDQRVVNEGGTTRRVTQPVDLPSGWEVPAAAPVPAAPGGMQTFGAMARFSATAPASGPSYAESAFVAEEDHLGYGSPQPGGTFGGPGGAPGTGYGTPPMQGGPVLPTPGSPWPPPVAPPPSRKRTKPTPPTTGDTTLAKFVTDELTRLRDNEGQDVWLRAGLLAALSERIRVQLAVWQQNNEPANARNALGALSTELATPTADPTEVEGRWQKAITTLTSLTTSNNPRSRQPFWKR
jgi:Ca-activated chloride channel homolog